MDAILFDLDDTLLDHSTASTRAAQHFHTRWGDALSVGPAEFEARWRSLMEQGMQAFARGEMDYHGQRRFRMRGLFARALTDAEADTRFADYLTEYEKHWRLFDDALACLEGLGDYRVAMITNGHPSTQARKLARVGLADRFEHVVTPTATLPGKPSRAIFERAAALLGVPTQRCVYVGDQRETDALAATRSGMRGIWLDRARRKAEEEMEVECVHDLGDLLRLLA